jgi:CDP-diglyceride synthetase
MHTKIAICLMTLLTILAMAELIAIIKINREESWFVIMAHVIFNYALATLIAIFADANINRLAVIPVITYTIIMVWTIVCFSKVENDTLMIFMSIEMGMFYVLSIGVIVAAVRISIKNHCEDVEVEVEGEIEGEKNEKSEKDKNAKNKIINEDPGQPDNV